MMRTGNVLNARQFVQLLSAAINWPWCTIKSTTTLDFPEEALRKNRFDDHKEENGGVWIEREARILEILIRGKGL